MVYGPFFRFIYTIIGVEFHKRKVNQKYCLVFQLCKYWVLSVLKKRLKIV